MLVLEHRVADSMGLLQLKHCRTDEPNKSHYCQLGFEDATTNFPLSIMRNNRVVNERFRMTTYEVTRLPSSQRLVN